MKRKVGDKLLVKRIKSIARITYAITTIRTLKGNARLTWLDLLRTFKVTSSPLLTTAYNWLILVFGEAQGNPLSSAPVKQVLDR